MACTYGIISPTYVKKSVNLRCMWWNNVSPGGLSMCVKSTKRHSTLAYEEMNIQVKGLVIMKRKCVKVNEWGDNMIRV